MKVPCGSLTDWAGTGGVIMADHTHFNTAPPLKP